MTVEYLDLDRQALPTSNPNPTSAGMLYRKMREMHAFLGVPLNLPAGFDFSVLDSDSDSDDMSED